MKRLMTALTIALVLASAAIPLTHGGVVARASEYSILVFPFFLQTTPSGLGPEDVLYAGVNITFVAPFGAEIVVDLNHNGEPDPGEPALEVDGGDDVYSVFIGYSRTRCVKPDIEISGDIGPLWILVDTHVVARYVWVGAGEGDNMAGYGMPPPSRQLLAPPLPGNIYVTPASTSETTVEVGGETYTLSPGQYLIIPHDGRGALNITADHPIAAALIHLGDGTNDTYATEVFPAPGYWARKVVGFTLSASDFGVWVPGKGFIEPEVFRYSADYYGQELSKETAPRVASDSDGTYYYIRYDLGGGRVASAAFVRISGIGWDRFFGGFVESPLSTFIKTTVSYTASGAGYRALIINHGDDAYLLYDYGRDGTYEVAAEAGGSISVVGPRKGSADTAVVFGRGTTAILLEGSDDLSALMAAPAGVGSSGGDWGVAAEKLGVVRESMATYQPVFGNLPPTIDSISWSECGSECYVKARLKPGLSGTRYIVVMNNTSMDPVSGAIVNESMAGEEVKIAAFNQTYPPRITVYVVGYAQGTQGEIDSGELMRVGLASPGSKPEKLSIEDGIPGTTPEPGPSGPVIKQPGQAQATINGEGYRDLSLSTATLNLGWGAEVATTYASGGTYELPETPALGKTCGVEETTTTTESTTTTTTTTQETVTHTETTTTTTEAWTETTTTKPPAGTTAPPPTETTTPPPQGQNTQLIALAGAGVLIIIILAIMAARRR